MGYLEAHYAHLIYHCRGSTAGGADVARAVVERVFRPLQKLSANPYFTILVFPHFSRSPQSAPRGYAEGTRVILDRSGTVIGTN